MKMTTLLQVLSFDTKKDLYAAAGVTSARFIPGNGAPAMLGFVTAEVGRSDIKALRDAGIVNGDEAADLDRQMVDSGIVKNVAALVEKILALNISTEETGGIHPWSVKRCSCEHTTHATLNYDGGGVIMVFPNLGDALENFRQNAFMGLITFGQAVQLLRQMKELNIATDRADEQKRFDALDPEIKKALVAEQIQLNDDLRADIFTLAVLLDR